MDRRARCGEDQVGAPNADKAFVYYGSPTGLSITADWVGVSPFAFAQFGTSVGSAGDVNGDGYLDVVVGARYYSESETHEGAAFVYYGSPSGLSMPPAWSVESDQEGAEFGTSVGTAGDVNGDGYADVVVGAPEYDDAKGRAYAYYGSETGLSLTPDWSYYIGSFGLLGSSVGTAGDVNGDGLSDVIVGAETYPGTGTGAAYLFPGSVSGIHAYPAISVYGEKSESRFGEAVGTAGDVNGDGLADFCIGAGGRGFAIVYHGHRVPPFHVEVE